MDLTFGIIANHKLEQVVYVGLLHALNLLLYSKMNEFSIMQYYITYTPENTESALHKLDHPIDVIGKKETAYCILFRDNIGDSPLDGGLSCIYGYMYQSDEYGAQIAIKYNRDSILVRSKNNNVWTSWKTV